jgi:rhodanese-related sulfurtransferase/polyisoprenoid-binding protein YceI
VAPTPIVLFFNFETIMDRRHDMDDRSSLPMISPQDLFNQMDKGEKLTLIDTLTLEHFMNVHIPGAENACVFEVVFLDNVDRIVATKDDAIVIYGSSPKTMDAVTACEKLVRAGYTNVRVLDGGLVSWQKKDYPFEGTNVEILAENETGIRIEDGTYKVDIDQSIVGWTGRNPNKKHYGTLRLANGKIDIKGSITGGTFEFDMTGIKNIDLAGDEWGPVLLSHLMSDDFFFVEKFPKAIFNVITATPIDSFSLSSPNVEITGELELRGNINRIAFPATVNRVPDGGLTIEAHFDIDRTRWKIIYGSSRFFEHLGMHLVFDLISIEMRLYLSMM